MEENRLYNFKEYLRVQTKEELRKKTKKSQFKNTKINYFRNSIGKLFRLKSQSEKSLKPEDLIIETVPSTIYLSPNASLPRDPKSLSKPHYVQKVKQAKTHPVRHSCSDFTCRWSNNFCVYETCKEMNKSEQNLNVNHKLISPINSAFYPMYLEGYDDQKTQSIVKNVPHSKSFPLQLSQSQQNINQIKQSNNDIQSTAKRNARKKSIFNCSLFRKRSNSRSKSIDKIHQHKPTMGKCLDKSKHFLKLENKSSNLSDRSLTLPNLKSSEVDLTSHVNNPQLLSIDLIKDYLNRSDITLSTSVQKISIDNTASYHCNPQTNSSVSVQNSPLSLPNRIYDSLTTDISEQNLSLEIRPSSTSAYSEVYNGKSIHNLDSSTVNKRALNTFVQSNNRAHFTRQISETYYIPRPTNNKLPNLISPPTGAVEFWTRPYQEKIKASRRRLLDDKVGSKEALLRSMSPQNIRIYEETPYDFSYHLQMIPEPQGPFLIEESNIKSMKKTDSVKRSNSFFSPISPEYRLQNCINPIVENRLSDSPIQNIKPSDPIGKLHTTNYMYAEDVHNISFTNNEDARILISCDKSNPELSEPVKTKSFNNQNESHFEGSFTKIKDLKNMHSSTEIVFTRTPTPPYSFAESSNSSAAPAPKEFLNDSSASGHKPNHGNVNLLYSSDNSSENHEEFSELDHDYIVPVPPPRTDSVIRSMQFEMNNDPDKSELEYDITDDFFPILSGASFDKCDIEQYHKWLSKLPYKLSEFPDLLHSRKSAVTGRKSAPTEELVDLVPENIGLLDFKHLKSYRKSIKSWNMSSDSSKPDFEASNEDNSHTGSLTDSGSMKKSLSCDHSLYNSDHAPLAAELDGQINMSQNLATTETTLLKQYSHLYSLKSSHNKAGGSISTASILKSSRSKSIDIRNFVSATKGIQTLNSLKASENRKSAPDTKIFLEKD